MPLPITQILEGRRKPTCIRYDEKVRQALQVMLANAYNQMPVIDDNGQLKGMISFRTMMRTYYHTGGKVDLLDLRVSDCQEPAPTLTPQDDFLDALNLLRDRQTYGIVIVENNVPVGILTHSDMTAFFRATSELQILVENIELILREYIETAFPDETSRNQAIIVSLGTDRQDPTRPARSYEHLGFFDELKLMTDVDNWDKFQGVLEPKELFFNLMSQVRVTRNQLAHFRGRPDAVQYDGVRTAMDWLETRQKLVTPEVAGEQRDATEKGGEEIMK